MFRIDKDKDRDSQKISLTRGDSATIQLFLTSYYEGGKKCPYFPLKGDNIILTVRTAREHGEKIILEKQLLQKSFFYIKPQDTRHVKHGVYWYDVQLKTNEGDIYTVVPPSKFEILSEVNTNA